MTKGVSGFGACNAPSNNVRGILWALLATGLFAVTGAMAKIAVTEYHVLQILFFRQIVVFMSALPAITASFPESLKTHHPGWHAIRLVGAFVALSSGIWAVAVLPLTTAITLGFVQVFFVALLSAQILRERVGAQRLVAICAGFLGVVIILRPGTGGVADWNAFIPIAGAMGAAVAVISVRKLSQTESTATLLAYQSIFVGVLAAIPLPWFWKTPDLIGFSFLLAMGVIATGGQWFGVKALRLAEASVIGNIQYMQLIYASLLGFVIFDEVPDLFTISGAVVIVGSALYLLHHETLSKRVT
ncbi:EamA/RhaT family transporter [Phaeobacter gallaeciensis]|uniref:EamA/RhaT family transporter n=1 Tax=Phaeobacter gallaeciensis TaxID=60890 RepID=A0A366WNL4_9RHOB|nr:DMT family transporter [Phaeobacter gallaeciensis]RBW50451.1 EamA/RhaT family transporter [Phaeobacter gallaeciensis]